MAINTRILRQSSALLCFLLLAGICLCFPSLTRESVALGLHRCVTVLIPALFPFLCISRLILALALPWLSEGKPMLSHLFCCFLGWICGFPIGAQAVVALYRQGVSSEKEAADLIPLVTVCSPSFALLGVGAVLAKELSFGVILLLSQWLSGALVFLLFRRRNVVTKTEASPAEVESHELFELLPEAVGAAAQAMLHICAMTVFFEVLAGCVGKLCAVLSLPPILSVIGMGLLEFSGGVMAIEGITSPTGAFFCGLFCAFGGVCVAFQVKKAAGDLLSFPRYFGYKALQGVLCGLFCLCFAKLF